MKQAKYQIDPVTKKSIAHYGDMSIFTVYVKRFNGRKVSTFMASGTELAQVLEYYNSLKVYEHDRKYLYHRVADAPKETEEKVLMDAGSGKRPRMDAGQKRIQYRTQDLSPIKNVPSTLVKGVYHFAEKNFEINGTKLTKVRLISILMASFLELKDEKTKIDFLTRGDLSLEKHKMMSGGGHEKLPVIQQDEVEDLL